MNELQARTFFEARSGYTQRLARNTKTALAVIYQIDQAERNIVTVFGGPAAKQEFISALVDLHYPLAEANEATHVLYHGEFASDVCAYCNPNPCLVCGALDICAYDAEHGPIVNGRHVNA